MAASREDNILVIVGAVLAFDIASLVAVLAREHPPAGVEVALCFVAFGIPSLVAAGVLCFLPRTSRTWNTICVFTGVGAAASEAWLKLLFDSVSPLAGNVFFVVSSALAAIVLWAGLGKAADDGGA